MWHLWPQQDSKRQPKFLDSLYQPRDRCYSARTTLGCGISLKLGVSQEPTLSFKTDFVKSIGGWKNGAFN